MGASARLALSAILLAAPLAHAMEPPANDEFKRAEPVADCYWYVPPPRPDRPVDRVVERVLKYTQLALKHRLNGLASYYSGFFDGRKTANGEIFRNRNHSAAHLTLPLGSWVEITARATGRKLRLRVNDRGPYVNKFAIDLSQAAARYLGVDVARDRYVDIRIIALPGEEPLPEDVDLAAIDAQVAATAAASGR